MQHLKTGLLHTAWADDLLFAKLIDSPQEVMTYTYANPEWPISKIASHILDGAEWYKYVLTGVRWTEFEDAKKPADLIALRKQLAEVHEILLACVDQPDELITFEDENGPRQIMRSTVLNQIVHHSTEHRAQIFVALERNGFTELTADDVDVWAWEAATK